MSSYNPYNHAEALGVKVAHRSLGRETGLWVPRLNTIFLRPGMSARQERSVLAHEIAHRELGHTLCTRKTEAEADRRAAGMLLSPAKVLGALDRGASQADVAAEFGVTDRLLRAFLSDPARGR
ncbi:ImmA/IrrE family metallo-endopeptidase [Mycetocola spongiae]|uniref:ImmA/IrrE family metallo-endopeptidase n=1 Tax=Mycetocola spongiae TaxID=2859226 RepID=UPI001CF1900C|nr:ImmA/IrrE family metallo-endopeptidase [Mycetocola spongiae]UCR88327.1 ImmA/IrrE family metallo-endopeptidase [Mycetocola spongiae]